jgi:hypothetical protein
VADVLRDAVVGHPKHKAAGYVNRLPFRLDPPARARQPAPLGAGEDPLGADEVVRRKDAGHVVVKVGKDISQPGVRVEDRISSAERLCVVGSGVIRMIRVQGPRSSHNCPSGRAAQNASGAITATPAGRHRVVGDLPLPRAALLPAVIAVVDVVGRVRERHHGALSGEHAGEGAAGSVLSPQRSRCSPSSHKSPGLVRAGALLASSIAWSRSKVSARSRRSRASSDFSSFATSSSAKPDSVRSMPSTGWRPASRRASSSWSHVPLILSARG